MSLASSLNVGVSALRAYSEGIQVVSNNIANVNTVGYKVSHAQYSDTFSNILRPMVPNENNTAVKIAPTQVGGGVQVESVAPVFSQGTIQITNSNSDLAIAGNGFFRVKNPQTGQNYVTRAGNFRVDADGYMVTQQGYRVQGSIGANTKVVYDPVNISYDVKGMQDNVKISIPPGTRTQTLASASLVANSDVLTVTASTDLAALKVGMPISGGSLPSGTYIKSMVGGEVTLSSKASSIFTTSTTAVPPVVLTLALLNVDSESLNLTFPPDYLRPELVQGMVISGPGIEPGTTVQSAYGNLKKSIPASASSVTLTGVNMTPTAAPQAITVDSVAGLSIGMVLSLSTGFASGAKVKIATIDSATNTITVDQAGTVALTNTTAVASGDKTLEAGLSSISLSDVTGIIAGVGMKVSGSGIPAGAYVGTVSVADAFGNYTVSLVDSAGDALFINTSSYSPVDLAFGEQTVVLNKRPNANTFSTAELSVSTEYTPASHIGDVKVSFTEGSDFSYYGTDGVKLEGIPLEAARSNGPKIRTFNVGTNGQINVILSNGQTFSGGSVLLQSFRDPGALTREGDNLFSGLYTAGPYNGVWDESNINGLTPSNGGLGAINGGALELSNVDLGEEFSTMIVTQRAFQAGSRVITTTDQMLEEAVNLKR